MNLLKRLFLLEQEPAAHVHYETVATIAKGDFRRLDELLADGSISKGTYEDTKQHLHEGPQTITRAGLPPGVSAIE